MDKDTARQTIRANWRQIIPRLTGPAKDKANGEQSWICPFCGHGAHGDGLTFDPTSQDGNSLHCFGCSFHGDIIDLYMKLTGTSYTEALSLLAQEIGITIDGQAPSGQQKPPHAQTAEEPAGQQKSRTQATAAATDGQENPGGEDEQQEPDYTAFFEEANRHLTETDYHRGISLETLNRYKVGFVPNWRHPKAPPAVPPSPRLIIPTSPHSYLARDTRKPIPADAAKYAKSKVGRVHIFNPAALAADQPVFVVEGELDALSIIDVGGAAVALGSVSNWKKFAELVKAQPPTHPIVLALDQDARGQEAEKQLADTLKGLQVPFYRQNVTGQHKDANEALNTDRPAFSAAIAAAAAAAQEEADAEKEARREELEKEAAAYTLQDFISQISASAAASYTPTGFDNLDALLDGGLYAGLYVVGAISSLGKTTFCLQIADQIAAAGQDVLIFSLEMARNELIAKSISRITLTLDMELYSSTAHAKTTRGILTGSRYARYNREEKELIQKAISMYGDYAKHIYIVEGVGDVGVKEIRQRVERHVKITGRRPVVLIDYLQIMAPADVRATDKQNTDKAVLELKRMSRDLGIPVIGISSLNRDNYTEPISMKAFKESGAIEYSSDVLIGLQYMGMDYAEGEGKDARERRIRELIQQNFAAARDGMPQKIQLKILKNRNGGKGDSLFDFYPMFNYFTVSDPLVSGADHRRTARRR